MKESPLEAKLAEMQQGVDAGKSLAVITAEAKELAHAKRGEAEREAFSGLASFDWRQAPPPVVVEVLIRKPFTAKKGEPPYYLTRPQAYFLSMRCFEMGVSALGTEAWFDPNKWTVSLTAEGQRHVARNLGLNLGPPRFERHERPWPSHKQPIAINGKAVTPDFGYTCRMDVNGRGDVSYTAWFSEWFRATDPWREQPDHMLQVRSQDHAIEFATGVGISNPIMEESPSELPVSPMPQIDVVAATVEPE